MIKWKKNPYCPECRSSKKFFRRGVVEYDERIHHSPDAESTWHPEGNPTTGNKKTFYWVGS